MNLRREGAFISHWTRRIACLLGLILSCVVWTTQAQAQKQTRPKLPSAATKVAASTPTVPQVVSQTNCFLVIRGGVDYHEGEVIFVSQIRRDGTLELSEEASPLGVEDPRLQVSVISVLKRTPVNMYLGKMMRKDDNCKPYDKYDSQTIAQEQVIEEAAAPVPAPKLTFFIPIHQFTKYGEASATVTMSQFTGTGFLVGAQQLNLYFYLYRGDVKAYPLSGFSKAWWAQRLGLSFRYEQGSSAETFFQKDFQTIGSQTSSVMNYGVGVNYRQELFRGKYDLDYSADLFTSHKFTHVFDGYKENDWVVDAPISRGFDSKGSGVALWHGYRPASWLRLAAGLEGSLFYINKLLYAQGGNFPGDAVKPEKVYNYTLGGQIDIIPFKFTRLSVGAGQSIFHAVAVNDSEGFIQVFSSSLNFYAGLGVRF